MRENEGKKVSKHSKSIDIYGREKITVWYLWELKYKKRNRKKNISMDEVFDIYGSQNIRTQK